MLAVTAASAAVQHNQQNKAIEAQQDAAYKTAVSNEMAVKANQDAVDTQAFAQRTDRAREAARQLAMARVVSAQGGGSLASMAINISGAAADDFSRIDVNADSQKSTLLGQEGAMLQNLDSQNKGFALQSTANSVNTGLQIGSGAASAAASGYSNVNQESLAKKYGYNPYFQSGA
jgi:hypothetical protein